jgi:hypothetical protein
VFVVDPDFINTKSNFMRKSILLFVSILGTMTFDQAQIQTPAPSPAAKVEQRIGLVDVAVEYSRPSVKGRAIFGALVPYDETWRTGANSATKITFSDDVNFGGAEVKKGAYALLTKPGKENWTIMLYPHNNTNWSSYVESTETPISVTAKINTLPKGSHMESFMIAFDELTNSSATLYLMWDNVMVPVPIKVNTDAAVQASIAKVMAGPSAQDYYAAAQYYLNEKKDMKQALEWVNKSIEMGNEKFWVLRVKSLIQHELGDDAGAVVSALRSLELAKEANNKEYIKMNEAALSEWRKG